VVLAALALIVIILGALLTSEVRTLPGAQAPSSASAPALQQVQRAGGYALAVLTLGLAIWFRRLTGWLALAAVIVEGSLVRAPVVHAIFAPVFFSLLVAIAVLTSKGWEAAPNPVESPWRPLRPLGIAIPILIVMQIGLGAGYRHNAMGVISHILNAMIVLLVVLVAGIFIVREYPEHPSLRPAALALLIITGVQVLLGFSVYLVLLMSSENNSGLIITGVMHVTNGALTLAASVVLAMQIERNLIQLSGA
jgi:heme A synthase